jgi:arylsulfatase A-like enzyme
MADTFSRWALAFIERERSHPFFLYLATTDIHVPRVPNSRFTGQTTMGVRGDAIVEFDDCVGAVLKKLDELKLADNTLVIVSSDNGPVLNDGYRDGAVKKVGDHKPAGPFRGGKYKLFEGGTRMPFLVRWPARVKPGVSDAMISQVDLCASLAALVGQHPATNTMPDSQNILPALLGESKTGRDHVVEYNGRVALRQGDWKLMPADEGLGPRKRVADSHALALYNLATDPGETNNVAVEHPEVVKRLSARLEGIRGARSDGPRTVNPD